VLVGGQGVARNNLVDLLLDAALHFGEPGHVEEDPAKGVGRGVEARGEQVEDGPHQIQLCQEHISPSLIKFFAELN